MMRMRPKQARVLPNRLVFSKRSTGALHARGISRVQPLALNCVSHVVRIFKSIPQRMPYGLWLRVATTINYKK